jgi:hypothetical protein
VKERLPEFRCLSEGELTKFEKKLTPNLSLILGFERIHHMGLGKAFTLQLAVDFPLTSYEGISCGYAGINVNLFHLFQRAWNEPTWVYATNAELAKAFDACETLLSRVLPAVEKRFLQLLSPVPEQVDDGVPRQGALSAREALAIALNVARSWADDVALLSVASHTNLMMRDRNNAGPGVGLDGRLRDHGCWTFRFESPKQGGICAVGVPHAGESDLQIWPRNKLPCETIETEFIDSTDLLARTRNQLGDAIGSEPLCDLMFELPATSNRGGATRWGLHVMCIDTVARSRKDVLALCDPMTGEVLEITAR